VKELLKAVSVEFKPRLEILKGHLRKLIASDGLREMNYDGLTSHEANGIMLAAEWPT